MYSPISVQVPETALWAESAMLRWTTLQKIRDFYKPLINVWPCGPLAKRTMTAGLKQLENALSPVALMQFKVTCDNKASSRAY